MKKLVVILTVLVVAIEGFPNAIDSKNVVTVPPNCPSGQVWVNGHCRDIWVAIADKLNEMLVARQGTDTDPNSADGHPSNVVVVPPNCPSGQEWVNGACRDVWRSPLDLLDPQNVVVVPPNCRPGQVFVNGQCRDVWFGRLHVARQGTDTDPNSADGHPSNVVVVPPNCPSGQEWVNGACRDVWRSPLDLLDPQNVVVVPPNCRPGQVFVNGQCRDVWFGRLHVARQGTEDTDPNAADGNPSNVVVVPPNCLPGQEWVNGACRDVWRSPLDLLDPQNMVVVPPNCRPGQVFVNGQCRDVWFGRLQ